MQNTVCILYKKPRIYFYFAYIFINCITHIKQMVTPPTSTSRPELEGEVTLGQLAQVGFLQQLRVKILQFDNINVC